VDALRSLRRRPSPERPPGRRAHGHIDILKIPPGHRSSVDDCTSRCLLPLAEPACSGKRSAEVARNLTACAGPRLQPLTASSLATARCSRPPDEQPPVSAAADGCFARPELAALTTELSTERSRRSTLAHDALAANAIIGDRLGGRVLRRGTTHVRVGCGLSCVGGAGAAAVRGGRSCSRRRGSFSMTASSGPHGANSADRRPRWSASHMTEGTSVVRRVSRAIRSTQNWTLL
jgi:hypothetical protein